MWWFLGGLILFVVLVLGGLLYRLMTEVGYKGGGQGPFPL